MDRKEITKYMDRPARRSAPVLVLFTMAGLFIICANQVSYAQEIPASAVKTAASASSDIKDTSGNTTPSLSPAPATVSSYTPTSHDPNAVTDDSPDDSGDSMVKMHGTYGVSAGFTTDEFIWKRANADWQEKNWRYVSGDLDVDTYDPRIFDRYELEIETDTETPWNAYADIVIDPWTFVAVGHETVTNAWGDMVEIDYKMWENTAYIIDQNYRTLLGNSIAVPELKTKNNRVTPYTALTGVPWTPIDPAFLLSPDNSAKLDYIYRPVRKLWVEYDEEPLYLKVFPIAYQEEALTSDDPLALSNNHVYWAPSPWLWRFDPGFILNDVGGIPLTSTQTQAMWNWDEQWFAEDSNRHYLTFLRGASASWAVEDFASLSVTAAAPLGLWDTYETVTSVPIAARFKINPNDRLMVGTTYASKYGISKQSMKANNQVVGFDVNYSIKDNTDVFGEVAGSTMRVQYANNEVAYDLGSSYKIGMKSKTDFNPENSVKWDMSFTSMSQKFAPGLSDYRDTREDRDWGRHIWFDPLSEEDQAIRIGNSVDINRYVMGANARFKIMDNLIDLYLNFRNAHESYTDKFVENVVRAEATYTPLENLQFKGLALDRLYHDSLGDFDPILRDRYYDDLWRNYKVQDGQDVQLMTFSGGAKVDLFDDKVSVYGVYEATNDPQDFPRGILNNTAFNSKVIYDNILFDRLITQVYDQDLWTLPPYNFYNMWKGSVTVFPREDLQIRYTHVTNTNQNYAALFDNNHTHDEIAVTYSPFKSVTWITGYSVSQVMNLQRSIDTYGGDPTGRTVDKEFQPHYNVYSQLNWDFKKDQRLILQFGEAWFMDPTNNVFGPRYYSTNTSVLDTRAIFRIWYQGKF